MLGGHRKTRIYGRFDCPTALRAIARGGYVKERVFFADEAAARAAGYRPCARCMEKAYLKWKAGLTCRGEFIRQAVRRPALPTLQGGSCAVLGD
ncbi:hypothetical protein E8E95_18375 [Pseudomonas sp. BN414]|uniref:Ada metal-binding domain-containing protein n=1 Tax=Pseudomonas sp. BN414 TaxID=2567888 RepID=UPI0032AFCCF5|nr:hypothetical protein [Pseudomonas sp. BN414]